MTDSEKIVCTNEITRKTFSPHGKVLDEAPQNKERFRG
jgi:hypothetical protein